MKEPNIYIPLWKKYRPLIVSKLKEAIIEAKEYQLSGHEFESIGDRTNSGYGFNLEIRNGILMNNIDGSAVARDLFAVLKSSPSATEFIKDKHVRINMTKETSLKIEIIKNGRDQI